MAESTKNPIDEQQQVGTPEETPGTEERAVAGIATAKPSESTVRFAADMALGNGKIIVEDHAAVLNGDMSLDDAIRRVKSGEVEVPETQKQTEQNGGQGRRKSEATFYSAAGQIGYRGAPNAVVSARKHTAIVGEKDGAAVLVVSAHISPNRLIEAAAARGIFDALPEGAEFDPAGFLVGKYDPLADVLTVKTAPTDAQRAVLEDAYADVRRALSPQEKAEAKATAKAEAARVREEERAKKRQEKEEKKAAADAAKQKVEAEARKTDA